MTQSLKDLYIRLLKYGWKVDKCEYYDAIGSYCITVSKNEDIWCYFLTPKRIRITYL